MRSVIFITAAALTVASCAQPPVAPGDNGALARELAGRVAAGPPESCVATQQSTNLRVIDRQTLAYEQGTTLWVNRLAAPCPGIEPLNTVIVEPKLGTQYCQRRSHPRARTRRNHSRAGLLPRQMGALP